MKHWPLMISIIASGLLAGCSTTSTLHYDLKAATPATPISSAPTLMQYQLAQVAVPESIDIESLVVRQPNNSLMVLSHDRWVAPLREVLQNALTASLTQSMGTPPLPGNMLAGTPARQAQPVAEVLVNVEQFEMQPANQARLSALWQIRFPNTNSKMTTRAITCYSTLSQAVVPGVSALVAAQQLNVQQLGQQIANTLKTGQPPQASNCQIESASNAWNASNASNALQSTSTRAG